MFVLIYIKIKWGERGERGESGERGERYPCMYSRQHSFVEQEGMQSHVIL